MHYRIYMCVFMGHHLPPQTPQKIHNFSSAHCYTSNFSGQTEKNSGNQALTAPKFSVEFRFISLCVEHQLAVL